MADEVVTAVQGHLLRLAARGRLAIVTMDNGADHRKPNVFGEGALASLHRALDEVESQDDVKGLLLTGKHFIFAVGADLNLFVGSHPERSRARRCGAATTPSGGSPALPFPTLAAINGACDGRRPGDRAALRLPDAVDAAAPIAFPEVFLSILPGWGGTQLTPRLIGAEQALQVIVHNALNQNKMLQARRGVRARPRRPADAVGRLPRRLGRAARGILTGEETIERPAPSTEARRGARQRPGVRRRQGARRHPRAVPRDRLHRARRARRRPRRGLRQGGRGLAELLPVPSGAGVRLQLQPHPAAGEEAAVASPTRSAADQQDRASSAPGSWAPSSGRCSCSASRCRWS
jgi:enoyl-CoA hydratase/carnithine racemase